MTTHTEHCFACKTPITTTNAAALYARISNDAEGTELGVDRQEEDAIDALHDRGYHVAERHWYRENDIGASTRSKAKARPKYDTLIAAAWAREIVAIGSYSNSRLTRKPREAEDILDLAEKRKTKIITAISVDLDLSTAAGRAGMREAAKNDAREADQIAERVARRHRQASQRGEQLTGSRAFGWKQDRIHLEPKEAKLIRKAAQDLISGESLTKIAQQWNAKGVRTPFGNPWTHKSIKQSLSNPRMAGWRVYQGKIAIDREGSPVRGKHKPILTDEVHDQVLTAIERPMYKGRATARQGSYRYVLSGLVRCGVCGRVMHGARKQSRKRADGTTRSFHIYTCLAHGHTNGITGDNLDALVLRAVQRKLEDRTVSLPKPARFDGDDRLNQLTEEIGSLMAQIQKRELRSTREVMFILNDLTEERDELEAQRKKHDAQVNADRQREVRLGSGALGAAEGDADKQRRVVADLVEAVIVQKWGRTGQTFDSDRAEIAWV